MLSLPCSFRQLSIKTIFSVIALSTPAHAIELCPDLNQLVIAAQSNFSDMTERPTLPDAKTCAMSQAMDGSNAYHCAWEFPYRADAASITFEAFNTSLQACFAGRAKAQHDQSVNHPDFYDLRQYQLGPVTVAISIKDKSALQNTYVFMRVIGAP